MDLKMIKRLAKPGTSKIILLIVDGLGGLPVGLGGFTELETADPQNLNSLCKEGTCGMHNPVGPGITPGSAAGHLALFGYDPLKYQVGRGVAETLGIGFDLKASDVAARGNFCTTDKNGKVTDRRAGRLSTEKTIELCELLGQIELPDVRILLKPIKQYRVALILRGDQLSAVIEGSDPGQTGRKPLEIRARQPEARETAKLVQQFLAAATEKLVDHHPANMLILRGFGQRPDWPKMKDVFGLRAAAVADYPMCRGLGDLIGMHTLEAGDSLEEKVKVIRNRWDDFDFFFLHVKSIDSAGEDGDFDHKVALIREVDEQIPRLMKLDPDVIVVTGDHSTPAALKSHSWHPVPFLLWSKQCRPDRVAKFNESACINGGYGPNFPAINIMPLMLASAQRLRKFRA